MFLEVIVNKRFSKWSFSLIGIGIILLITYIGTNFTSFKHDILLYFAIVVYIAGIILGFVARSKKEEGRTKYIGIFLTTGIAISYFFWYFYKIIALFISL